MGWIADYPIMDNFLYPLFPPIPSVAITALVTTTLSSTPRSTEARTTVDDEERVAKMQEADAMVAADCPVIPVMFYTHTLAGSDASSTSMSIARSTPSWVPLSSPKSFAASVRVKYLRRPHGETYSSPNLG